MDDARPHPLADDPTLHAGLDDLDRGLTEPEIASSSVPRQPAASEPLIVTPFPTRSAQDAPIVAQPGSRRPLLDLFPPTPASPAPHHAHSQHPRQATGRAPSPPRAALRPEHTFYGFIEPPFALEPDLRFLYHSFEHDRVAREIVDAIGRRDRLIVLTAPTGMGKTLLCRSVAEQLGRRAVASLVERPAASFDVFVQQLLADFGVLSRDQLAKAATTDAQQRTKTLRAFLASLGPLNANAVVFVDEAQNVPVSVLRAVHALALDVPGTLQVVLAGQPSLTRVLADPELRDFSDRIATSLHLGPLAPDEVPGYVVHRTQIAAGTRQLEFDDASLEMVYDASRGVPRVVNQLCDRALARAHRRQAATVGADTVHAAAEDLGVATPPSVSDTLRNMALGVAFALLMAVGAGAATWVFRDRVHRILVHYGYLPPP